jgi:hypothetical protein
MADRLSWKEAFLTNWCVQLNKFHFFAYVVACMHHAHMHTTHTKTHTHTFVWSHGGLLRGSYICWVVQALKVTCEQALASTLGLPFLLS